MRISLNQETRYVNGDSAVDGLIIFFEAGNNNAVDNLDAPKLFNIDESFARENGSNYLSIERRDNPVDNESLNFYNITYRTQDYVFTVDAFQIPNVNSYLKDTFTGQVYEIGTGNDEVIYFSVDNNVTESIDPNRFEMFFIEQSDYIFDTTWTNLDPCISSITATDNLNIVSGNAVIDCDIAVKNITIAEGATLQIASGRTVTVHGDMINLGTLMTQGATIELNNSANVYSNDSQLDNLSIVDNSILELSGSIDVYGTVQHTGTGTASIDNKNATITLKSTATSNAYYLPTNLQLTSPVTSEAYLSARRAYRFISSPVTTSTTIYENWQENGDETIVGFGTDITGNAGTSAGFDPTATNNPSLYTWDNAGQSWVAQASTNNAGDVIEAGVPYRLFSRGDRQVNLGSNIDAQRETILRSTGTLHTGDYVPAVLSETDGAFNMIGNPYAAPFNLDGLMSNLNMVGNPVDAQGTRPTFFYVWDPNLQSNGAYVTYDTDLDISLNSSSQVNGFLQPYQVAFVIANGNTGDFTFKETYLDVSQSHTQVTSVPQIMRIELVKNQEIKDGAILKFDASFSNQLNKKDAPKVLNLEENLSIIESTTPVSIAARNLPIHGEIITLNLSQLNTSNYSFEISPISVNGLDAYLKDNFTGQLTPLNGQAVTSYAFFYDLNNPLSSDASRFQIEFLNSTLSVDESAFAKAISLYPNPSKNGIVNIKSAEKIDLIKIYSLSGQQIMSLDSISNNGQIDVSKLTQGMYVLSIDTGGIEVSRKLIID